MKILYFILGSFKHKFGFSGLNSYSELLKEDIVFFGPIDESSFEYNSTRFRLIRFFDEISIFEVFKQLPDGWLPDIVHCDTSVLNYVPDIYRCPVKTCLYTGDAWADTVYNRRLVEFFDFTRYGVIDKEAYRDKRTHLLSTANCVVSVPEPMPEIVDFSKRTIDVLAIARYFVDFYHERFKVLYKTAALLNSKYRIEIRTDIARKDIHHYYQKSKIVLDWSHTPSNRSYEAALNGCLFFSHEKNKRISEVWTPWVEYIPYNENNLEALIEMYLNDSTKADSIIQNAQTKLKKLPFTYGGLIVAHLKEAYNAPCSIADRVERVETMPREIYYHCLSTPFFYNYNYKDSFPGNWKEIYFKRIDKALSVASINKLAILLDACRMAFLIAEYDKCNKYLDRLEDLSPGYAWLYYLRGRIQKKDGYLQDAVRSFGKALSCGMQWPPESKDQFLPYIEKNNTCDVRRLVNYMWQGVEGHNNEYQVKALLHMAYEQLGDVSMIQGKSEEAVVFFQKAIEVLRIPDCAYKLNDLLALTERNSCIIEASDAVLRDNPYDTRIVLDKANAVLSLGKSMEYRKLLRDHRKTLRSFKSKRMVLRRMILLVHICLPVLGNSLAIRLSRWINSLTKDSIRNIEKLL